MGRTEDREVELALSVPDTLFPGFYQLEVGSAATLGPDELLFAPPQYGPPTEESLDDVFARLNKPDENVLLKARLAFVAPFPPPPPPELPPELPPEGEGGEGEGEPEGEGEHENGEGEPEGEGEEGEDEGEGESEEGEGEGEDGEPEGDFDESPPPGALPPGPPPPPPGPISTQQDVDLLLQGIQFLEITVVPEEFLEEEVAEEEVVEEE